MTDSHARRALRLGFVLLLLGIGQHRARADVEDRITVAIPLSGSAQVALLQMRRLVTDPQLRAEIEAQLQVKIRLRALECGQSFVIAPGSSNEQIRREFGGSPCLATQDAAIADWLGIRTVGAVLELPPLRPMAGRAPQRIADVEAPIQSVYFAAQSGVAVVSSYKDIEVVDMAAGVPISTYLGPQDEFLQSISPNGRVYTTFHQGQLRFYESEDGTLLASARWCVYLTACGFHWLDDRTVLIYATASSGTQIYDFRTGDTAPFDNTLEPVEAVAALGRVPSGYVAFRDSGLTEFRLDYANGQPHADVLQTEPIRLNLIPSSGGPLPGGRYYANTSNGQIYVSDMNDLRTDAVDFGGFFVQRVLPEADPDRLLIAGYLRGGPTTWRFYDYALRERSVSPVDTSGLPSTQFFFDPAQNSLFVLAGGILTQVDTLPHGPPVARDAFAASMHGTEPAMPPRGPAVFRGFLPPVTPAAVAAPMPGPVAQLARSADVQGIGIFGAEPAGATAERYIGTIEGTNIRVYRRHVPGAALPTQPAAAGVVRVEVRSRHRPLVLVLSSFASIQWRLRVDPGARLAAVLITGPHGSFVQGQGNVPVVAIGSAYSYMVGSPGYVILQNEVYEWTGKRMTLFQCGQRGKEFLVY